ncbi:hypothetical protein IWX75_000374 [Arthrobacter sp. CAN_A6]|uniref:hypothetical protein n=1 Tax=unclassified Arthrobacter TaxID=235627 RepID=UPI0004BA0343|nr:hypothetical protein [Arthrobacter sp. H41]
MNITNVRSSIQVRADNALQLEERLNAALEDLQHVATGTCSQGILIDRTQPGHYTVSLSSEVPYGYTHERSY